MSEVSIVIPVYNAEKNLRRCLESVIAQDFKDYEVILVNDGSTDSSLTICKSYCANYPNFALINQNNYGVATARNNGIDLAQGNYIYFIDADDYIEPDTISSMYSAAKKYSADVVICNYYEQKGEETKEHRFLLDEGLYCHEECTKIAIDLIDDVSATIIPPYSWLRMIKREKLEKPKMRYRSGLKRSEDYHFAVRLHLIIDSLYLLSSKHLYHYVENLQSITHSHINGYWSSVKTIYDDLKSKVDYEDSVHERLDVMFLQRTLIAINNSVRCKNLKQFKNELYEILNDPLLRKIIKRFSFVKNFKNMRFFSFCMLLRLHLNGIIYLRYKLKFNGQGS